MLISGIVALTLTPMLSAKILRVSARESRFHHTVGAALNGVTARYSRTLDRALARPFVVMGGAVVLTIGAVVLFLSLKREFVPPEDRGFFFTFIVAPEGSTVQYTDDYLRQLEAIVHRTKDVNKFAVIGSTASKLGYPWRDSHDWTTQRSAGNQARFTAVLRRPGCCGRATPRLCGFQLPVRSCANAPSRAGARWTPRPRASAF